MGRLAVDQNFQGQGLGGALLGDALHRSIRSEIMAYAMVVDAKDDIAKGTLFAEFFLDKKSGYEEWLFGKVSTTLNHVAADKTELHEHADAMTLLKGRLKTRLRKRT